MLAKNKVTSAPAPSDGNLRYPNVAYQSDSDYVKFTFYNYTPPFSKQGIAAAPGGIFASNVGAYNASSSGLSPTGAKVLLYMPEDIESQYGASWTETNLSNIARGALGGFGGLAGNDPGAGIGTAFNAVTQATVNQFAGTGITNAISQALSSANFGSLTVNDIFSSTTGQILNPNTEVLYKGPKMRNFSLNFKMAPKDDTEAKIIRNIIRPFKYAMRPQYGGKGGSETNASFVKVPQIVDVTFMKGGAEHDWVSQYKPAVITNFDVSYTPDGAWATYDDGSPVATSIKISFQETKMVYADELSNSGATY